MDSVIITISLVVIVLTILGSILSRRIQSAKQKYAKNGIPYLGSRLHECVKFIRGQSNMVNFDKTVCLEAAARNVLAVASFDIIFFCNVTYIRDVDVLKNIFVKDFEHFVNKRQMMHTKVANKHFRKMLFQIENDQWKGTRAKLSPAFTTGRLKRISVILQRNCEDMITYLKKDIGHPSTSSGDINFTKMIIKFGIDVIASSAFGIDSHAWNVKNGELSIFEQMGARFGFRLSGKALVKYATTMLAPSVMDFFNIDALDYKSRSYFETLIKTVAENRRKTGSRREDVLQLMLDIQQGLLKDDDESEEVMNGIVDNATANPGKHSIRTEASSKIVFDDDDLVAHGLTFWLAGLDPVISAVVFALYALAVNSNVQDKLHKEIVSVLEKNGGSLEYEAVQDMAYLDMVTNESLRFFPPGPRTERVCTKDYKIPGSEIVIEKGETIVIPIYDIHHNPEYYPNPDQFIPERFSLEEKSNRSPYAFLPFGIGPRNCIAMRFALIELKMAVAHLVQAFEFSPSSMTQVPMEFARNMSLRPSKDIWLRIKVREN